MINQLEHHFILFSLIFLLVGFLLGLQLSHHQPNRQRKEEEPEESFVKKHSRKKKKEVDIDEEMDTISIDSSTHVVKIKTEGLEKKYEEIAEKSSTNEDINASVNKLKMLKK